MTLLFPELDQPQGDWPVDYQERFWELYPRRVARRAAMTALDKVARQRRTKWPVLIDGLKRYVMYMQGKEPQYILHGATWLNGERWKDELPVSSGRDLSALARDAIMRSSGNGYDKPH